MVGMYANHTLRFRPLRGGVQIFNPDAVDPMGRASVGTLGCIVLDAASGQPCLLSTAHSLCGANFLPGARVFQPDDFPADDIAGVVRADVAADAALARLDGGAAWVNELAGLGPLGLPVAPVVGLAVIKSGAATGITEGRVSSVNGAGLMTIELPPGFDAGYQLSQPGDSGALWVTRDGLEPVGLHLRGERPGGSQIAIAVRLDRVLNVLGAVPV